MYNEIDVLPFDGRGRGVFCWFWGGFFEDPAWAEGFFHFAFGVGEAVIVLGVVVSGRYGALRGLEGNTFIMTSGSGRPLLRDMSNGAFKLDTLKLEVLCSPNPDGANKHRKFRCPSRNSGSSMTNINTSPIPARALPLSVFGLPITRIRGRRMNIFTLHALRMVVAASLYQLEISYNAYVIHTCLFTTHVHKFECQHSKTPSSWTNSLPG